MSTFDPQKLNEAKRKKKEERRLAEEEEEAREAEREREYAELAERNQSRYERHMQLSSYVKGLYDEMSKLSTKRPEGTVSKMTVDRVNRAIEEAQELLADEDDPFIGEIEKFVPAGDLPENRDVVLVLRQIKDALDRMEKRHWMVWRTF